MYFRIKTGIILWLFLLTVCERYGVVRGALPTCTPTTPGVFDIQSPCKFSSLTGVYQFSELNVDKPLFFESSANGVHSVNITGRLKLGILGSIIVDRNKNLGGVSNGISINGLGSGGSHAGRGGTPKLGRLSEDVASPNGDPVDPKEAGGRGGDGTSSGSGGAGGGCIQIWSNICEIAGSIQANGEDAEEGKNGGGGAGGSVSLVCKELIGSPVLEARGGLGDGDGGGGSGGRVSLQFESGSFDGETGLHAQGGRVGMF